MKKEIYRSFEGFLNIDNQSGYIIYDTNEFYEVEFLNVCSDTKTDRVRIRKNLLRKEDFGNLLKIGELQYDIENGRADYGQCYYKDKWYGYKMICKIQKENKDGNWKKYV